MDKQYYIHSESEAKHNGSPFWNNDNGWVACMDDATMFTEDEVKMHLLVPASVESDACWKFTYA